MVRTVGKISGVWYYCRNSRNNCFNNLCTLAVEKMIQKTSPLYCGEAFFIENLDVGRLNQISTFLCEFFMNIL